MNLLMYIDRAILIYYIYKHSIKLSYIVELIYNICVTNNRKIILFCDWSIIFWIIEMLIMLIDFNVLSIRVKYKTF